MLSLWTDPFFTPNRWMSKRETRPAPRWATQTSYPQTNLVEREDVIEIQMDLPGVQLDDLTIETKDGTLTISGTRQLHDNDTRWSGSFERSYRLSDQLDLEGIEAKLEAGVLTVSVPRRPEAQPRRIAITSG